MKSLLLQTESSYKSFMTLSSRVWIQKDTDTFRLLLNGKWTTCTRHHVSTIRNNQKPAAGFLSEASASLNQYIYSFRWRAVNLPSIFQYKQTEKAKAGINGTSSKCHFIVPWRMKEEPGEASGSAEREQTAFIVSSC